MIALIVIIIGAVIAYCAEDNGDMQGFGVGVVLGALVVGLAAKLGWGL